MLFVITAHLGVKVMISVVSVFEQDSCVKYFEQNIEFLSIQTIDQ